MPRKGQRRLFIHTKTDLGYYSPQSFPQPAAAEDQITFGYLLSMWLVKRPFRRGDASHKHIGYFYGRRRSDERYLWNKDLRTTMLPLRSTYSIFGQAIANIHYSMFPNMIREYESKGTGQRHLPSYQIYISVPARLSGHPLLPPSRNLPGNPHPLPSASHRLKRPFGHL